MNSVATADGREIAQFRLPAQLSAEPDTFEREDHQEYEASFRSQPAVAAAESIQNDGTSDMVKIMVPYPQGYSEPSDILRPPQRPW